VGRVLVLTYGSTVVRRPLPNLRKVFPKKPISRFRKPAATLSHLDERSYAEVLRTPPTMDRMAGKSVKETASGQRQATSRAPLRSTGAGFSSTPTFPQVPGSAPFLGAAPKHSAPAIGVDTGLGVFSSFVQATGMQQGSSATSQQNPQFGFGAGPVPKGTTAPGLSTAPQGNSFMFGARSLERVADTSIGAAIARNKKPVVIDARRPSSFGGPSKNFGAQFGAQKIDLQPVPAAFKRVGSKRHAPEPAATEILSDKSDGKQAKPKFCFRCFSKGHATAECQATVFCEICESSEHVKQKCPITKAAKNVVQWVGHALDGNGFFHIPHAPFKGDTDKKTAKITVDGGVLSIEQLTEELQNRIPCPSTWVWDIRQDEDAFIVTLPTDDDLQRIIMYGGFFLKEKRYISILSSGPLKMRDC